MYFDGRARTLRGTGSRKESMAARVVRSIVAQIECGQIAILLPSGERIEHAGDHAGPSATIVVHRWRAIRRLVSHGDIGFADAYIDGDWSSPDLVALLELAARNITVVDRKVSGFWAVRTLNRLLHLLRTNSKAGSRRNIAFHYDLGNKFFGCWLDSSMTYSSAFYENAGQSLEDAQNAKLSRILELLDLRGGENVLEIGCGWGALAVQLARAGAVVTGITLSSEHLTFARQRVQREALASKVSFELTDYRDTRGV